MGWTLTLDVLKYFAIVDIAIGLGSWTLTLDVLKFANNF